MKRSNSFNNIQADANSTASSEQIDVVGDPYQMQNPCNFSNSIDIQQNIQNLQTATQTKQLKTNFQGSFRSPIKLARQISNAITTPNPLLGQVTPYTQNQLTPTSSLTFQNLENTAASSGNLTNSVTHGFHLQQTPTPTGLIKNCETEGIFNDLRRSANGFEARKALEAQSMIIEAQTALLEQVRRLTPLITHTQVNPFNFQNIQNPGNQLKLEITTSSPVAKFSPVPIISPPPKLTPVPEISPIIENSAANNFSPKILSSLKAKPVAVTQSPKMLSETEVEQTSPASEAHASNYPVNFTKVSAKRGRKRIDESESDAQEKRKKFLERNRKAAARCREKKKTWITDLESNAVKWSGENEALKSETVSLKAKLEFAMEAFKSETGKDLVIPDK